MKENTDNKEKAIRIGCGGLLGMIVGFIFGMQLFITNFTAVIIVTTLLTILFGIISLIKGDEFWDWFIDSFKRWF
jgi:uncharacterized membrane protein